MKTIIILVTFMCFASVSEAQTTQYDTCSYINTYAGEWRYVNGQDTIRIYLRANRVSDAESVTDRLWGWQEYKQGNQIIISDYQHRFMTLSSNFSTMYDSSSVRLTLLGCGSSALKMNGRIDDYLQSREPKSIAVVINSTHTTMTWTLNDRDGYGFGTGATGRTLPKVFTLTKQ